MELPKRYNPRTSEPPLAQRWVEQGTYHYHPVPPGPTFAIDTPPPTVSGDLHLGHIYSYSQTDFIARFHRMRGEKVFYPMGFDDNGLPTERLVERRRGLHSWATARQDFVKACLEVSREAEQVYTALWQRVGLSVDWRLTYQTNGASARRLAQASFLDLLDRQLVYRQRAPALWCPECRTAIAQADVDDQERDSAFVTMAFGLSDRRKLAIATTRPELLPACVAVFVHPGDVRYAALVGQEARVPLFDRPVPILADPAADPEKGTGAVMCCTFGDSTDVQWWRTHQLPHVALLEADGRLGEPAGPFSDLTVPAARAAIIAALEAAGLVLEMTATAQTIGVHERCDTPVEYRLTPQWFVRVLDFKEALLDLGQAVRWEPAHMESRYRQWVENLGWDWCISRQRTFGVPIPIWYCSACGAVLPAVTVDLPMDPQVAAPPGPCPACGSVALQPETDVLDTWATSSMSPDIAAALTEPPVPRPFALRPQAHEIIRTWAFYTLVKACHHGGRLPWTTIALSGWGLAPEGEGKISKSRGGGPLPPLEMIERYSADAVRYWAASTGLGKDARISEEKIRAGQKLVTKLWNVARFAARFWENGVEPAGGQQLTVADRWILARLHDVVSAATERFLEFDYAAAKNEIEQFFWRDLADNYLEMAKQRLYAGADSSAAFVLRVTIENTLKLFAPFLPFVTDEIYSHLFASRATDSIHQAAWPTAVGAWRDAEAVHTGALLVSIATAVRRYKSEQGIGLATGLTWIELAVSDPLLRRHLESATGDLTSITRAAGIRWLAGVPEAADFHVLDDDLALRVGPVHHGRA